MGWNYLYNLGFDHLLVWLDWPLYKRGMVLRAIHALMFEAGLTIVSIPVTMIWLNYTLIQALLLDLGFLIVVPIYTLCVRIVVASSLPSLLWPTG